MAVLGITGGIATGKSSFTAMLKGMVEAEFFDSDVCAKELLDSNAEVRQEVRARVGAGALDESGEIDRGRLRKLIFDSASHKAILESILHPRIRRAWVERARRARESGVTFVVDIPLLFETKAETLFDRILVVACGRETQIGRMQTLRNMPLDLAERIIASQIPIKEKVLLADHVAWNDGAVATLRAQAEIFANILS